MKKWMKKISAALLCGVLSLGMMGTMDTQPVYAAEDTEDMRAVWISTVYSADYPSVTNDIAAQKAEFIEKLDKIQAMGMNTVVVQVRPKGDAFYESALNPWSAVLTGVQGQNPGYDPMEFMIAQAHQRGMEFHAWMNPYRITTSGTDLAALSADNMARKHPDWILTYNNAMYYDPSREEVKEYLCNTVTEIVEHYDVDAIHFDDYFYPSNYPLPEGEDKDGTTANIRRAHVNDFINRVHQAIKKADASVEFGISPMGVWKNNTSDPQGSATKGSEGYYTVFGDAKCWVEQGWVDYIVPQIYWERGNSSADYETLVKWWSDLVAGTDVKLYIGHGIYKDVVAGEITEQLDVNAKYDVDGSFYFSLRDLLSDRQGCATALKAYYQAQDATSTPSTPAITPSGNPEKMQAYAGRASVTVDGRAVDFEVYTINDYTYFKLRDIAGAVNGTKKQFTTFWDVENMAINLMRNAPYTATGGSTASGSYGDTLAIRSTAKLYCDGKLESIHAYTIHDYTYYKLRDLAQLLDMGITWDETAATIGIETTQSYQ